MTNSRRMSGSVISNWINLRAGYNWLDWRPSVNEGGLNYKGDVNFETVPILLDFHPLHGGLRVTAGVYYNNADVHARASGPRGQPIEFIDDEDVAAFVGDVVVGLLIPMGPRADLRIGYQGLYLDGVGLAPDQSDNYSIFTASGSLDQSTAFYHGGFIGIDLFF